MFPKASKFVLTELQKEHQLAIKAEAEAAARSGDGGQDDDLKNPINYNGFTLHMSKCMARRVSLLNTQSSAWQSRYLWTLDFGTLRHLIENRS